MANLIPEVRTDRNGKKTTRWVKPERNTAPATVIPPVKSQESQFYGQLVALLNQDGWGVREGLAQAVSQRVSPEDASKLIDLLGQERPVARGRELTRQVTLCVENPKNGKFLLRKIIDHAGNPATKDISESFLLGLSSYKKKMSFEQESALLQVADTASHIDAVDRKPVSFPFESYALSNPGLVDLVMEQPDKVDEIKEIISVRKTDDHVLIRELLEGDTHNSLFTGAL